jgi:sugar (pentulose or hexulose) kinase
MPFFLGLDAGGTNTTYVLADETQELARVRSGTFWLPGIPRNSWEQGNRDLAQHRIQACLLV